MKFVYAAVYLLLVPFAGMAAVATNQSTPTLCAESDNVCFIFTGSNSYRIKATHPDLEPIDCTGSPVDCTGSPVPNYCLCCSDFTNCGPSGDPNYEYIPAREKIYDDGTIAVYVVRKDSWWLPRGMTVAGSPIDNVHLIQVYHRVGVTDKFPEGLTFTNDGYFRLTPQAPDGVTTVCPGASVIIGPIEKTTRELAEIASVAIPSFSPLTFELTYASGAVGHVILERADRTETLISAVVNGAAEGSATAALKSMYVADDNCDIAKVRWSDISGSHSDWVLSAPHTTGSEWFFYRDVRSRHNSSAPDITIDTTRGPTKNDLNGDGRSDMILQDQSSKDTYFCHLRPDGSSWDACSVYNWAGWDLIACPDLNGDGRSDLLLRHAASGYVYFCLMRSDGCSWDCSYAGDWNGWELVKAADLNGDGRSDLLLRHAASGHVYFCLMRSDGGSWDCPYHADWNGWHLEAAGDFNGDGRADLLLRHVSGGCLYFCLMRPDGASWDVPRAEYWGSGWSVLACCDLNGNRNEDLILTDNANARVYFCLMRGNGCTWDVSWNGAWDSCWSLPNTADYNGDTKNDLLLRLTPTNQVFMCHTSTGAAGWSVPAVYSWGGWSLLP